MVQCSIAAMVIIARFVLMNTTGCAILSMATARSQASIVETSTKVKSLRAALVPVAILTIQTTGSAQISEVGWCCGSVNGIVE